MSGPRTGAGRRAPPVGFNYISRARQAPHNPLPLGFAGASSPALRAAEAACGKGLPPFKGAATAFPAAVGDQQAAAKGLCHEALPHRGDAAGGHRGGIVRRDRREAAALEGDWRAQSGGQGDFPRCPCPIGATRLPADRPCGWVPLPVCVPTAGVCFTSGGLVRRKGAKGLGRGALMVCGSRRNP